MSPVNSKHATSCVEALIAQNVPSRLHKKDASLYKEAANEAQVVRCMGWTDLASNPPYDISEIVAIAKGIRQEGLDAVVLIGQGGSSQASMTVSALYDLTKGIDVAFYTMDSLSPVTVNQILQASDPARTLYIVSSKSGSTIEPLMLERVAWQYVIGHLGSKGAAKRFVAITDPGSKLEQLALVKDYRFVLSSPSDVGGRFSALCVFALFPAACAGIDIEKVVATAALVEQRCAEDSADNPALDLACFIFENYQKGRDKIALVMPRSGAVFGLWLEQLIAESSGKQDLGVLPYLEVDASLLREPHDDRIIITNSLGRLEGFAASLEHFDPSIPVRHHNLDSIDELFGSFVIWEFATAMLGYLMGINPFDQPNVEDTKKRVRSLLSSLDADGTQDRAPGEVQKPDFLEITFPDQGFVSSLRVSNALLENSGLVSGEIALDDALEALVASLTCSDYLSINAFVPSDEYAHSEALERMRNRVASRLGVAACLEIGPRYLHSTGQLHKGGPNMGVFCYISSDDEEDIEIPGEEFTLGKLAATQAQGDFSANAARGRRAIQVHLANNDAETLCRLADQFCLAVSATTKPK